MMGLRIDALVFAARAARPAAGLRSPRRMRSRRSASGRSTRPTTLYIGDVWLAAVESSSDGAAAAAILEPARRWIEAAAARLPEEFRASFRDRNPANRELLARAGSRPAEP